MTNHNPVTTKEQPETVRYIDRSTGAMTSKMAAKTDSRSYVLRTNRALGTLHLPVRNLKPKFDV